MMMMMMIRSDARASGPVSGFHGGRKLPEAPAVPEHGGRQTVRKNAYVINLINLWTAFNCEQKT